MNDDAMNVFSYHADWRWSPWFAWRPVWLGKQNDEGFAWLSWVERSRWEFSGWAYYCYRLPRRRK